MIARSLLFIPGHNLKFMESAVLSKADILLPDVEDSVQPLPNKQLARDLILSFVNNKKFTSKKIYPRVNSPESGELIKDITQLSVNGIDGFMYQKLKLVVIFIFLINYLNQLKPKKVFQLALLK